MADQLDSTPRAQSPDEDGDDPLAELARIIGYEKPTEAGGDQQAANEVEASAFDLEAELMRELDVLPSSDADDERGADVVASIDHDPSPAFDPGSDTPNQSDDAAGENAEAADDIVALDASWLDNKPQGVETDGEAMDTFDPEPLQSTSADNPTGVRAAGEVDELGQVIDSGVVTPVAATANVSAESPWVGWEDHDADAGQSDVFDVLAEDAWQGGDDDLPAGDSSEVSGPAFEADNTDPTDDVLADMVRFDLPGQGSGISSDAERLAKTDADDPVPSQSNSDELQVEGPVSKSADPDEFDLDLSYAFDDIDGGSSEDDGVANTDTVADTVELTSAGSQTPEADDASYQSSATADSIDFEDYLSAELDVFGYQTPDISEMPVEAEVADTRLQQSGRDQETAQTFEGEAMAERQAAPVSDADADPFGSVFDDTELVFDEAAEELLADIEQDAAIAEAGDQIWPDTRTVDAGSGQAVTNAPEPYAPPADSGFIPASDATEDWSEAELDEGLSEELREELEDSFGLASDDDDADVSADADELEFDLEEVLAATVIDNPAAPADDAVAEASQLAEEAVEQALEKAEYATPNLIAEADADPELDEMEKAFLDLVPEADPQSDDREVPQSPEAQTDPAVAVPSDIRAEVEHTPISAGPVSAQTASMDPKTSDLDDDWLSGFEPAPEQSESSEDTFYFDASTISEPEEPVQPVGNIDVPEIADDDPLPAATDYDADIEREFADIIDLEGSRTAAAARVLGPQHESGPDLAGEWSVENSDGPGHEASDDYIALERELGVEDRHVAPPYRETNAGEQAAASFDGEYAAGMSGEPEPEKDSRGPMVAFAVLGLALLAGAGAFGWSMLSGGDTAGSDGPRIIRADKDPVKVLPENPGGVTVPNQDKVVYDRVAGGNGAETGQPSLVNTAEEPVDVVQRTLDPDMLPLEGRDAPAKSEERLAVNSGEEAEPGAAGAPVVSPRRVRTMIVKPDGSIVAREDPAPEEAAPAAPATAPTVETAEAGSTEPQPAAAEDALVSSSGPTQLQAAETPEAGVADAADGDPSQGTIAPVRVVTTQPIRAPIPQGRPADQPVNVVGTVTQGGTVSDDQPAAAPEPEAAAQPVEVAAAPAAAAPAANRGGYYMQIASQPTAEGAQASWRTLSARFATVLGGRGVDIQRADIPGKGVFHRVRVPAGSRSEANALCSRYKAAGGSCFVSR